MFSKPQPRLLSVPALAVWCPLLSGCLASSRSVGGIPSLAPLGGLPHPGLRSGKLGHRRRQGCFLLVLSDVPLLTLGVFIFGSCSLAECDG